MIRRSLPLVIFTLLVLAAGVAQGLYTNRWRSSVAVENAAQRLDAVPLSLGDWRGEKESLDSEDLKRSGIKGHAMIRYRNAITGRKISLLIVCGRPGPISVHTPDVCYGSAGYEAVGEQYRKPVPVGKDRTLSVWALQFKAPRSMAASQIEVHWAWNGGDGWVAPPNPRLSMSGYGAIYKMYVVREVSTLPADQKEDPAVSFLQTFLPELEKVLSPQS
jgi:hypothetical protein